MPELAVTAPGTDQVPAILLEDSDQVTDFQRATRSSRPGTVPTLRLTPGGVNRICRRPGQRIRVAAIAHRVPLLTTLSPASAAVAGIRALRAKDLQVRGLQEHYRIAGR
jgi:hypothetical protein